MLREKGRAKDNVPGTSQQGYGASWASEAATRRDVRLYESSRAVNKVDGLPRAPSRVIQAQGKFYSNMLVKKCAKFGAKPNISQNP